MGVQLINELYGVRHGIQIKNELYRVGLGFKISFFFLTWKYMLLTPNFAMILYLSAVSNWKRQDRYLKNFVSFDSLCSSQQFFSYVGMGLPGLNQY